MTTDDDDSVGCIEGGVAAAFTALRALADAESLPPCLGPLLVLVPPRGTRVRPGFGFEGGRRLAATGPASQWLAAAGAQVTLAFEPELEQ